MGERRRERDLDDVISVTIPGVPYAQKRARAKRVGEFARVHDHPDNKSWKGTAQVHMLAALDGRGPFDGPLRVTIVCWFPCPKSMHRKRTPRPADWYTGAKDYDNLAKSVGDAGNGVLWLDDRQIVDGHVLKYRCAQGQAPAVYIDVEPAGEC